MTKHSAQEKPWNELEMKLIKRGIPKRFVRAKWDDFNFEGYIKELRPEKFKDFISGEENRGFFFCGSTGSGKTFLASIIAKQIYLARHDVIFINITDLKTDYLDAVVNNGRKQLIEYFGSVKFLFLNDIGSEKTGEGFEEFLFTIIDKREMKTNNRLLITSNLDFMQIADKVHDRIPSRLAGMCGDPRMFKDVDWRDNDKRYDPSKSDPVSSKSMEEEDKDPQPEEVQMAFDNMIKLGLGGSIKRWLESWKNLLREDQIKIYDKME